MNLIHQIIWKELGSHKPIDPYRRNLQKSYVGALNVIINSTNRERTETDAYSIVRADLIKLQKQVHAAIPQQNDTLSKIHLQDMEVRIRNTLEEKRAMQ